MNVERYLIACVLCSLATISGFSVNSVNLSSNVVEKIHLSIRDRQRQKALRPEWQGKLETSLLPDERLRKQLSKGNGISLNGPDEAELDVVDCEILADVTDELLKVVVDLGGSIVGKSVKYHMIRAKLPYAALQSLSERKDVKRISRHYPNGLNKLNTTEGDKAHKANVVRSSSKFTGKGVKVGVISDSARYLADLQATGDLPKDVVVLKGFEGYNGTNTGEGSGMMEIVHDLAPDCKLLFASGDGTCGGVPGIAESVEALTAAGCDIIVDDLTNPLEPAFSGSEITTAISAFTKNGGIYFSSSANSNNEDSGTSGTWEGDYRKFSSSSSRHRFSAGNDGWMNELTASGSYIILQWADSWNEPDSDYDLYLYNEDGRQVAANEWRQGSQLGIPPIEIIDTRSVDLNTGRLFVVVVKHSGQDRFLRIDTWRGQLAVGTDGSTYAHNATECAITCAAASANGLTRAFSKADPIENYSSDGPRRVFFDESGNAITPGNFSSSGGKLLQKPEITAADDVKSKWKMLAGRDEYRDYLLKQVGRELTESELEKLFPFGGTSAAAPHAAAIAALMLEANPSLCRDDVMEIFKKGTFSGANATWNRTSGYGILNAEECVRLAVESAKPPATKSSAPTGVSAVAADDGSKVSLSWGHADSGATFYIYRSEQNAIPSASHATVTGKKSYEDTKSLVRGKTYYYWVSAKSAGDDYAESDKVAFGAVSIPDRLKTPVLSPGTSSFAGSVAVKCSTTDSGATLRYTRDGKDPTASSAVWPSAGLTITEDTTVKVRAYKSGSEASAVASATYTRLIPPDSPTGLKVIGGETLSLSWTKVAGAAKYRIYRNTSNAKPAGTFLKEVSGTTFPDAEAVPGKTYYYWVAAVGDNGLESEWTGPQSGSIAVILEIDPTEKPFSSAGGKGTLSIRANVSWTVTCSRWITPIKTTGTGSDVLSYTVAPNEDLSDLVGQIVISDANDSRRFVELKVTVRARAPVPALGTAVGNSALQFWTSGDEIWSEVTTADAFSSLGAYVRSGTLKSGESSSMETVVSGSGTLRFWFASSSSRAAGKLTVFVDGNDMFSAWNFSDDWQGQDVDVIGSGEHRIRWEYSVSADKGDYVKLDGVEFGDSFRPCLPDTGRATPTEHLVELRWDVLGEWTEGMTYAIYRGESLGGVREKIHSSEWTSLNAYFQSVSYKDETATPGVQYYYWLEGENDVGTIVSSAVKGHRIRSDRPENDDYMYATKLTGASGTAEGTTAHATLETIERGAYWSEKAIQSNGQGANTIWWTWTAPAKGTLTLDFSASEVPVVFEVYALGRDDGIRIVGIGTQNDVLVASVTDGQTRTCRLNVEKREQYRIRVAGYGNAEGRVSFDWSVPCSDIWYVNGATGSDGNDGTSAAKAKKTIQAAVDLASSGQEVVVADGVYAPFTAESVNGVTIRSEHGAQRTVIDASGSGQRGVCLGQTHEEARYQTIGGSHFNTLDGFTVRNGSATKGGGIYGGCARSCIISNNAAGSGGGAYGSVLVNCLLSGNSVSGTGGGAFDSILTNCTVVGNSASKSGGGIKAYAGYSMTATCVNSILWDNVCAGSTSNYESKTSYELDYCCAAPGNKTSGYGIGGKIIVADPQLDRSSGLFEPAVDSPCVDAGNLAYAPAGTDLLGNPRVVNKGIDLGAVECQVVPPPVCVTVTFEANGGSGNMEPQVFVVGAAQALSRCSFVRSGLDFLGWSKLPTARSATYLDGQTLTMASKQDLTLYAVWGTRTGQEDPPQPVLVRPENDDFASAYVLTGDCGTTMGLTEGATSEKNERKLVDNPMMIVVPGIGAELPPTNTIWWTWQAPFAGTVTLDFSGSEIGIVFDVYARTTLPTDDYLVRPVVSSYDGSSTTASFSVTAGTAYAIRVAGLKNAQGLVRLAWLLQIRTWYVNATTGDDANDGLSRTSAKRTIQSAVDCAGPNDTVWVAEGTYAPFTAAGRQDVEIRSEKGPALTVIDGTGVARCAYLGDAYGSSSQYDIIGQSSIERVNTLVGFTLCKGAAGKGAGVYGGIVRNCILRDNSATAEGGGAYGSELVNCLIVGNEAAEYGGGVSGGDVRNCTIVGNCAPIAAGLNMKAKQTTYDVDGACRDSVVWDNKTPSGELYNYSDAGALYNCCSYPGREDPADSPFGPVVVIRPGGRIIGEDPLLNADSGLFEPMEFSPCLNAGSSPFDVSDVDLWGNARVVGKAPDLGAVECQTVYPTVVTVSFDGNGGAPALQQQKCLSGTAFGSFPEEPTRVGHSFAGWFDAADGGSLLSAADSIVPESATTVYAHWSANVYSIGYSLGEGGVAGSDCPVEGVYGETIAVPAPTRAGFRFVGWQVSGALDTTTARWGTSSGALMPFDDAAQICGNGRRGTVFFSNLSSVQDGYLVLTALWVEKDEFDMENDGLLVSYNGKGGDVVIPEDVTAIGPEAFAGCAAVKSLVVPATVKTIGDHAFRGSGLVSVEFLGDEPEVGIGIYQDTSIDLTTFVHRAAAGWTIKSGGALPETWPADDPDARALDHVAGAKLTIASAYGTPNPGAGEQWHDLGDVVRLTVDREVMEEGGRIRHVCVGWTGTGSVPEIGNDVEVSFRLEEESSLTWEWRTDCKLSIGEAENGRVTRRLGWEMPLADSWHAQGSELVLTATPDDGYEFVRWTGDIAGCAAEGPVLNVTMDCPRQIGAVFKRWYAAPEGFSFEECETVAEKGGEFVLTVYGGSDEAESSVKVNATYGSAKATDLVLKTATVEGESGVEQRNLKFPLTLNWAKGDTAPKTITIPTAKGKSTDAPKSLVWNLSAVKGLDVVEYAYCIGTIVPGSDWTGKDVYVLPYVADSTGGKVSGGASVKPDTKGNYKAVTLKATANKGYWFAGWYDANGALVSGDLSYKVTPDGSDSLPKYAARFVSEQPSLCGTYNGYSLVNLRGMTLVKNADTSADVLGEYAFAATLSTAGKVTGSVTVGGKKITLKGDAVYDAGEGYATYLVSADEKACFGKANIETLTLDFYSDGMVNLGGYGEIAAFEPLGGEGGYGLAWKDVSKDKDESKKLAVFAGTYAGAVMQADDGVVPVSITVDKTGKVKLAGKYSDGTALTASGAMGGYGMCVDGTETAELELVMNPKALGSGAYHLRVNARTDEVGVPSLLLNGYTTTYTEKTVEAVEDGGSLACLFTSGCWIPEDADPDFGVVRLTSGEDIIDILYTSKNGKITGLGKATATGYTVKFDTKTGLLTVTKGKEYTIQGVLGDYDYSCQAVGRINKDGTCESVDVSFMKLPDPAENFPWTDDGFVLTLGQNFGEEMQPSVRSDVAPVELTISGLPTGLKYDKKTGLITGAPTKSGEFTVKVSYAYGTQKITRTTTLVVKPKPEGLPTGTYAGYVTVFIDGVNEKNPVKYPVTATIDKNGALSGSITLFGKKVSFKASGYDSYSGASDYRTIVDLKTIDKNWGTVTLWLSVSKDQLSGGQAEDETFGDGLVIDAVDAWRNQSKDAGYADRVAPYVGAYVGVFATGGDFDGQWKEGYTTLAVTVDKKGAVKLAGTFVDGTAFSVSSQLNVNDDESGSWATVDATVLPKALSQGGMSVSLLFERDGETCVVSGSGMTAARYVRASGDYAELIVAPEFVYRYASLLWVDSSVSPLGTCLQVSSDGGAFEAARFAWKTKVVDPICGQKIIIGVDKKLSGPSMTFKLDDKTGLFSGTCGTYKIFGAMQEGTCSGVGTVVGKDGSMGRVTVGVVDR